MYIVLEYLIIENFIINFLILYLTMIITRNEIGVRRLVLGAFIASLYSLAFFSPVNELLLSIAGKIGVSMLIIRISSAYINFKIFLKTTVAFYITSFVFAGATIGTFFTREGNNILNSLDFSIGSFPVTLLIIGIFISFLGCKMLFKYFNKRVIRDNYIAEVTIHYNNQKTRIKALLDTGNSLVDPISKKKVMVVDYKKLKDLLPASVEKLVILNEEGDFLKVEKQLNLLKDVFNPILIPYKSVGQSSIIIGFIPDYIEINFNGVEKVSEDIIIGLYSGSLTDDMGYSGLLNFEMNWGNLDESVEVQN